ncbi:GNAT family N-acetyltransferase [Accumulibacter sp.]|uniref:GNAT family N-acetyltransferase n=1 Tax=Accumulibacter sp. TaxID=2053492 RepID=UPI0025907567|nr:GNAT family N-acetyltransferase [Accumulibacter sp.]
MLGHDGIDRQSLIEEKDGPRSPTFAPVAAPLVYLLELAAFLIGERQCFGFAGQGEAFGMWEESITRISRRTYPEALSVIVDEATGEYSVAVADAYAGQGIGSEIMRQLLDAAHGHHLKRIVRQVLSENDGMVVTMDVLGFSVSMTDDPEIMDLSLRL